MPWARPAAEGCTGCTGCTGCRRLEMQLRRNGDGQLLPELRSKEAAACRKRLDVHLRPEEHRKILLRLRQAAPCRGLDLRLRRGKQRRVLLRLRQAQTRTGRLDLFLRREKQRRVLYRLRQKAP